MKKNILFVAIIAIAAPVCAGDFSLDKVTLSGLKEAAVEFKAVPVSAPVRLAAPARSRAVSNLDAARALRDDIQGFVHDSRGVVEQLQDLQSKARGIKDKPDHDFELELYVIKEQLNHYDARVQGINDALAALLRSATIDWDVHYVVSDITASADKLRRFYYREVFPEASQLYADVGDIDDDLIDPIAKNNARKAEATALNTKYLTNDILDMAGKLEAATDK